MSLVLIVPNNPAFIVFNAIKKFLIYLYYKDNKEKCFRGNTSDKLSEVVLGYKAHC